MKSLFPLAILLLQIPLCAQQACFKARNTLDEFLLNLPRSCQQDSDCGGYYYRANACAPPVVLAKPGVPKSREPELLRLQADARAACAAEFSHQPACSPIPVQAHCSEQRCVDAFHPGGLMAAPPEEKSRFSHAIIGSSCAPWDGPALEITASSSSSDQCRKTTAPYIRIAIWRNLPTAAPATIVLDVATGNGYAGRCAKENACEAAERAIIRFTSFDSGRHAAGTYELHFKDGSVVKGAFDAEWCHERVVCG
jgi:hypothetical protein